MVKAAQTELSNSTCFLHPPRTMGLQEQKSVQDFFLGLGELAWIPAPVLQMRKLRLRQGLWWVCAGMESSPVRPARSVLLGSGGADQCPRGELSGGLKCGLGLSARWADAGTATRALNIHSLDRTLIKQSKVHYYLIKFFIGSLIGLLVAP